MAAASTYKEIQDRTLDLLSKSDTTTRNRVKNWINMGQEEFVTRELWPFRETKGTLSLVAGTQEYDLSTNFSDIDEQNIVSVALQGANQEKLPYVPFNQLRAKYPDFDKLSQAVPQRYYIVAGKIGFHPVPDSAYSVAVDYYKLPTDLDADSDESIIPKPYRKALIHYALMLEHDFNTDPDLSIKSQNRFEEVLASARINLLSQPTDTGGFQILGPADSGTHWTGRNSELV